MDMYDTNAQTYKVSEATHPAPRQTQCFCVARGGYIVTNRYNEHMIRSRAAYAPRLVPER